MRTTPKTFAPLQEYSDELEQFVLQLRRDNVFSGTENELLDTILYAVREARELIAASGGRVPRDWRRRLRLGT